MSSVIDLACGVPWAIHEPALRTLLEIAAREPVTAELLAAWKDQGVDGGVHALATRGGPRLEGTRAVTMRDGVAVLAVRGPIFRHANLFTAISGATSLALLAQDFAAAVDSRDARAILLELDSPGGETAGISEFAAQVRAATAIKPVVAYVDHLGASAAYWIAAAASSVAVSSTAVVGSIGVVSTHRDTRERDTRDGVRTIEIVSSQSPFKRVDPGTDDGRSRVQALVDRLASEFVGDVAAFRGVTAATVLADFGGGGLLVGADAVAAGMADRVSGFEAELAALAGKLATGKPAKPTTRTPTTMETRVNTAPTTADTAAPLTAELVARDHPAIAEAFRAEGRADGAAAERARILGIEAQALPGHEALICILKADGATTPEQAAVAVLAAERGKLTGQLAVRRTDEASAPPVPGTAPPAVPPAAADPLKDDGRPLKDRAQAAWDGSAAIQAEFKSFGTYLAALQVEAAQPARRR